MAGDVLPGAVAGELADDPARDSPGGDGASGGGIVFSHKLSVTAFGTGRITRFG